MPVNTSTFIAKSNQSHWVYQIFEAINIVGDLAEMEIGSTGTGKTPVEFDNRKDSVHSWHLGSPDTGLAIPKDAVIDKVRVRFVPSESESQSDSNANHGFKVLMPDGHWNRSRDHALHQQQGAASYGPPMVNSTTVFLVYDETLTNKIAETIDLGAAITSLFSGNADIYSHTNGCTVFIPANTQIGRITPGMVRFNTPGTNPNLRVNVYELTANGRQYALDSLIGGSDDEPYLSLPLFLSGDPRVDFDFSTPIPAKPFGRWVGMMIEGDWFDAANMVSHRIGVSRRSHDEQEFYQSETNGSEMIATKHASAQAENSFVGLYWWVASVPVLYEEFDSGELTMPYPRGFGQTMDWSGTVPLAWVIDTPITYGDIVNDVADEPVAPPFLAEIQAFINSPHYNPATGSYWLGMMFDKNFGVNQQYKFYGPSGAQQAITLELDWHSPLPELCSFPIEATPAVVSEKLKSTPAVESFSVEAWPAVISEELESHLAVESFAITSEPAVQSFPLVINGEC